MAERLDIDPQVIKKYQDVVGRVYQRANERVKQTNPGYDFDYSQHNRPAANPSPVTAQPFSPAPALSNAGYPHQQQSYHGNVRSLYSAPAGGSFYDSGSVHRAVFTDQYPR